MGRTCTERAPAQCCGRRGDWAWMLHTPEGHCHDHWAAVVVGGHHDLPPGLGESHTPALDCTLGFPDEAYLNYILHGESYDASRAAPDI